MEQILEYISNYGLAVFIIASIIIAIIGILKLCKVFSKITNKNIAKLIYYGLDFIFAFSGSAIYFAIFKLNFNGYIMFSIAQVSATTTLYAIYENFGLRKLVQLFTSWLISKIKQNPNGKLSKVLKSFGLTEEKIVEVQKSINDKLEEIKVEKQQEKEQQALNNTSANN